MQLDYHFLLASFTALFTLVNPIGAFPVFLGMTEALPKKMVRSIAIRACITTAIALVFFALSGNFLFSFFSISLPSLKIVGGVLFFLMGYDMLQARLSRIDIDQNSPKIDPVARDIAITPIAIPMLCGPGAITAVILQMQEAPNVVSKLGVLAMILLVSGLCFLILISGEKLKALVGESGNKVFLRMMGIIVMVIAVEFFFSGLRPIVQSMHLN